MRYEKVKPADIGDFEPVLHSLLLMATHVEENEDLLEDDDEIADYFISLDCFHSMTALSFDPVELRGVLSKIGVTVHSLGPIIQPSEGFFETVILTYVNKNEFMRKIEPYRHGGKKLARILKSRGIE